MRVDIYERGDKTGSIEWDGKKFNATSTDKSWNPESLLEDPIYIAGRPPIDAKKEPEEFLKMLHVRHRSAYLSVTAPIEDSVDAKPATT